MAEEDNLLRVARPTINVAGEDDPRLASGLLKLAISENTQGLFRCEATFGNWDVSDNPTGFLYFDRRKLDFGKAFKIKFGADSLFDGRIMGLEASFPEGRPPEITVLAEDRFQDLRMTRRTRTFTDVTDAEVMSQIANEHGLSPAISVQGPSYKVLAQVNQSDLAFLRERARSVNAELWMDGSKLNVKPRASRNGSAFEMTHGKELREFTVIADLANQRSTVCVNGWDVAGKSALQHEASDSVISGELNGDTSGASILASALARTERSARAHRPAYRPGSSGDGGIFLPDDGAALPRRPGGSRDQQPTASRGIHLNQEHRFAFQRQILSRRSAPRFRWKGSAHRIHRGARRARQVAITSSGTSCLKLAQSIKSSKAGYRLVSAGDGTAFIRHW